MYKIVLLRHGESTWNKETRFAGWTDVDVTGADEETIHAAAAAVAGQGRTKG